jgi:predicted nucleotidyltransferase/predicted transcriptional regulator
MLLGGPWIATTVSMATIAQGIRLHPRHLLGKSMQKKRQLTPYMHQTLASLLFPEYRRRVLGLLLLRPEESLHGREVARRTGLPAGTITRELTKLAEAGLLRREKRGNQQVYSANTSGPIFAELASILRKTSGLGDVLSAALAPLAGRVKLAFVFGSVARGEEAARSDVDVLLVGDAGFRDVVEALYPAQTTLGRESIRRSSRINEFAAKARSGAVPARRAVTPQDLPDRQCP